LLPACTQPVAGGAEGGGRNGGTTLNPSHVVLRHRRYMPIIGDLKCVLNIEGVPRRFLGVCLRDWVRVLTIVQLMNSQHRKQQSHVEYEPRDWIFAFNANISLCTMFDCMVSWMRLPLGDATIPDRFPPSTRQEGPGLESGPNSGPSSLEQQGNTPPGASPNGNDNLPPLPLLTKTSTTEGANAG
ncbi:unnamed protein product, partial [Discosporangium mesarthrocarpum]